MSWDDGKHTKVKKVKVTFEDVIHSIEVEYDGTTLSQPRGTVSPKSDGFTLSSDEYITEVNGYSKTFFAGDFITALTFKTNKNTYGPYGKTSRNYFSFNAPNGNQVAGFLGTSGNALNSIAVHFAPIPPAGNSGGGGGGGDGGGNNQQESDGGGGGGNKPGSDGGGGSSGGNKPGTDGGGGSGGNKPGSEGGGGGGGQGGNNSSPQKVGPGGGKGGNVWNDTENHDGVTKIYIVHGASGIEQIKFDYVKNGATKEGTFHGVQKEGSMSTFEINHPNEYLVSVNGWYDSSNIIQGIRFVKNTKACYIVGYEMAEGGKPFSFEAEGKKIIGFHGFADSHLNSLGAYFGSITSTLTPLKPGVKRLDAIGGGDEGVVWDDGDFDGVKQIDIGQYHDGVCYVKIQYYNKVSKVIEGDDHGESHMLIESFKLNYPSEYIIALEGEYEEVYVENKVTTTNVLNFKFVTNKNISQPYGVGRTGKKIELKEEGHKIVGFHGKAGKYIHQIGVYVAPITN